MDTLSEPIAAYQAALDQIPAETTGDAPSRVMSALLARDHVAHRLAQADPSASQLGAIAALDHRLQCAAVQVDAVVGRATLGAWRESAQPATAAWWWRLDERAAAAEPKPSPVWTVMAGFFLTISISVTAEIARRFLSVGPDFVGVFSTLLQGLLALLAGRSLTDAGQHTVESALDYFHVPRKYAHIATAGSALAVLLLVLGLRLSLPAIAHYYNNEGVRLYEKGQLTGAILNYQRALSLQPNYAEASYDLGAAYEDVLAFDLALSAYQTAVRLDPNMYAAYNNLSRVYMLYQRNYSGALPLLNAALNVKINLPEPQKSNVMYSLLKNRGWAYLGLKYLTLATIDLQQALQLRPEGAAAHCLMAQVIEAQGNLPAALPEWEACVRFEKSDVVPVEDNWIAQARERLSAGAPQ